MNEEKIIELEVEKPTLKDHIENLKMKACYGAKKVSASIRENKELWAGGVSLAIAAIPAWMRHCRMKRTEQLKTRFIYDRSAGHYWQLRRPLSQNEWIAVNERRRKGESYAKILSSMRLLK